MYFGLKGRLSSVTLRPHPVSICQLLVLAGETAEYVSIPPLLHCTSGPNNFPQPWALALRSVRGAMLLPCSGHWGWVLGGR